MNYEGKTYPEAVMQVAGMAGIQIEQGGRTTQKQFEKKWQKTAKVEQKPVSFIPVEVFKASLKCYKANHFVKFLINLFGVEVASQLVSRYFIGTSNHRFRNKDYIGYISEQGANIFWQIDSQGKVRTGKIMLYSPDTGRRVKQPFNHINWAHTALKAA